jgi:phosphoglycerate dehydrogenase-like enzyme
MLPRILMAGTGFPAIRAHLAEALPGVELHAVEPEALQVGVSAEVLIPAMARVDGPFMDRIAGLRLIHQWGAGLEGVDVAAASARKIAVANVPTPGTGNAESVAEWCVMAALALSRRLAEAERLIGNGLSWGVPEGRALLGRCAGIVGLGGIGQALAARLRAFGMRLAAVKRHPEPALAERFGLEWLGGTEDLHKLLSWSEILFLCLPVDESTRGLIGREALALLPRGAILVNAARGRLVDEDALLVALSAGRLGGAGLDVFQREPLDPSSPLLKRPDVLATPHIAGVTDVSYRGIAKRLAANVRRVASGGPYENCVNSAAIGRPGH